MPPADRLPGPARTRLARLPRPAWLALGGGGIVALLLLVLASFDVALLRHLAERRLSAATHRRVTIDRIERLDRLSLAPRLRLVGIRVAQPDWAGPGDMMRVREAVIRVAVLPALFGHARPTLISVTGAAIALVHDAGSRANWKSDDPNARRPDAADVTITTILIHDTRFTIDDRRRRLKMAGTAQSDERGVRVRATGLHRDAPAQATLTGPPVIGGTAGKPWPFRAAFASGLTQLTIDAAADRPLDFSRFAGQATARGDDLRHIDDLLLIGLIPTQPVRASSRIRRAGDRWELTQARLRIGRSDLAGTLTVDLIGGRHKVTAAMRSAAFDHDDLLNAVGLAHAAAETARIGDRIVPGTKIDLAKLRTLDGRLELHVARLLSTSPSIFRSVDATLVLDHGVVTARPIAFGLTHGRLKGRGIVTHPAGQARPKLMLDLALVGGRIEDLITTGQVAGPLRGRITLTGSGGTIRDAVAHADGSVAFAARGGAVTKSAAELLGRNLGAAFGLMIGGSETRTPLRCLAARFAARGGVLHPGLFAIDTGVMRATGHGTIALDGERIALTIDGQSKHPALVRLPAPITVAGTLAHPIIETADAGIASPKTVFKALGQAIGRLFKPREAPVPDMDCGALMAQVGV